MRFNSQSRLSLSAAMRRVRAATDSDWLSEAASMCNGGMGTISQMTNRQKKAIVVVLKSGYGVEEVFLDDSDEVLITLGMSVREAKGDPSLRKLGSIEPVYEESGLCHLVIQP